MVSHLFHNFRQFPFHLYLFTVDTENMSVIIHQYDAIFALNHINNDAFRYPFLTERQNIRFLLFQTITITPFSVHGKPHILLTVYKYMPGSSIYSDVPHPGTHITHKVFRIPVINDIPILSGTYPQTAFTVFHDLLDVTVGQRRRIIVRTIKDFETISVVACQTGCGSEPHKSSRILVDNIDLVAGHSVPNFQMLKHEIVCNGR